MAVDSRPRRKAGAGNQVGSNPMMNADEAKAAELSAFEALDHDWLTELATQDPKRVDYYRLAELYYDGEQKAYLTERAKEFLNVEGVDYNENFMETIVDALVERVKVIGFSGDDEDLDAWLWGNWWVRNRGDMLSLHVFTEAAKKGDAYLILDWDAGLNLPVASFNRADRVKPCYHEGVMEYASKWWNTNQVSTQNPSGIDIQRLNVYYPDRVEKFYTVTKTSGSSSNKVLWVRWQDDGDTAWPVPWVRRDGKPRGIPVFHFANKARPSGFGRSEIAQTIPQQNRLNKELIDLSLILDQMGWPQRYASGVETSSALKSVPGEVWQSPDPNSKYGQFDAAAPQGPLASIEATLVRIAIRSNTPVHRIVIHGGWPSGEALKVAEAGYVAKIENRQVLWGAVIEDCARMAAGLAIEYAAGSEDTPTIEQEGLDRAQISAVWVDPNTRNEKEHLETLTLMKALGVSDETIFSMIPGIDAETELARKKEAEAKAAEEARLLMDAGALPGPGNPPTPFARQQGSNVA